MLKGSSVIIHTDSAGSMQKLTNVDSWTEVIDLRLLRIFTYIIRNFAVGVNLFFQHILGKENVIADLLSRWRVHKLK